MDEKVLYVVHSDMDENNLRQEFEELADALNYAKDNIDSLTYIEEVVMDTEEDVIYSTEVIWSYEEDDAEDQVVCEWCGDITYESDCRRELNLGLICSSCQASLYSRGEKPVFEEAYITDDAEGDDIFDQDFEDAKFESKYVLDEFFDADISIGLDGGDNNAVRVLSSYDPEEEGEQLDEFFDADINVGFTGGTGNNVGVLSPLGEGIHLKSKEEQEEFNQLCKEIGITKFNDLAAFKKEVGCTDENILQALRDYRAELGPDFEIKNEAFKVPALEENPDAFFTLPTVTVAEIKESLNTYGNFIIDLPEVIEISDEYGWRGASELEIAEVEDGYEGYYTWLDQEGEVVEDDPVFKVEDFENLLYAIDMVYAEVTDLDEYIGSELAEGLAEAKHIQDRPEPIECEQELEGTDNAVVDCKVADVVAHCEDEKPLSENTKTKK